MNYKQQVSLAELERLKEVGIKFEILSVSDNQYEVITDKEVVFISLEPVRESLYQLIN